MLGSTLAAICVVQALPLAAVRQPIHPSVEAAISASDEPVSVWVFFKDKGIGGAEERAAALARLAECYNPRAVRRRTLRRTAPGLFDDRDLSVCESYVQRVLSTGAKRRVTSRWVNAVSVTAGAEQVRAISRMPFVRAIEPVRRSVRAEHVPIRDEHRVDRPTALAFHGLAEAQLQQIGILDMYDAGFTGQGVVIGVLDTGFKRTHEAFNQPGHVIDVIAEYDFVSDDFNTAPEQGDPSNQHSHGTLILGALGAYMPNTLVAGAFDASFILAKTEDMTREEREEEDFYVAGLEFIEANGGDMTTSSLGYIDWYTQEDLDGRTAVTTIGVNTAIENGLVCVTAAGNGGHDGDGSTLIAPADAFDVITCGAVRGNGNIADFSSRGPTADGRVKPEALARGVDTKTVDSYNDDEYRGASGTSLSTPLVASAVALLIEAHADWTVKQIRHALFSTADYYVANGTYDQAWVRGYGVINVFAASQMLWGDVNCDGGIDAFDIEPFLLALFEAEEYTNQYPDCDINLADVNGDGVMDAFDIEPFLNRLFP